MGGNICDESSRGDGFSLLFIIAFQQRVHLIWSCPVGQQSGGGNGSSRFESLGGRHGCKPKRETRKWNESTSDRRASALSSKDSSRRRFLSFWAGKKERKVGYRIITVLIHRLQNVTHHMHSSIGFGFSNLPSALFIAPRQLRNSPSTCFLHIHHMDTRASWLRNQRPTH